MDWKESRLGLRLPHITFNTQRWLPTPGTVIFTLLVVTGLLVANRAGALTLATPNVASTATIPYQGRLTNADGTPRNGLTSMEFRLYNMPSGGAALWAEFWTGSNSVLVSDGMFSILLGSLNNTLSSVVQGNSQLWLGVTVNTDAEMSPRVQLGSAAYALQALTVPNGSIGTAKIADGAVTAAKISDATLVKTFAPSQARVQYGSAMFGSGCTPLSITYPTPYNTMPIVVITQREAAVGYAAFLISSVTNTGFFVNKFAANCETGGLVNWIAIGN